MRLFPVFIASILLLRSGAAFELPRHVFTYERLGEAQQESFEEEKPLLLLYADPRKNPS